MEPLFKHWRTSYERIEKFISDKYFTDINLFGRQFTESFPISDIQHFHDVSRAMTIDEIVSHSSWRQFSKDERCGPTWSIHWFRVALPSAVVRLRTTSLFLRWNTGTECLVFDGSGRILEATNSVAKKEMVRLDAGTVAAKVLFIQATCSNLFGAGKNGTIAPTDPDRSFGIKTAELVIANPFVRALLRSLKVLMDFADNFKDQERGYQALFTANKIVNLCGSSCDDQTYERAVALAKDFFSVAGSTNRHVLHAIGNCHIDTAWLWSYEETARKCARSWSSTLRLLTKFPKMVFACSQAQQLFWLKENYPALFAALKEKFAEGQFLPVGGVWIEMDTNLPSGESLIRQFLYGQKFFRDEFGSYCKEFWLPDTFGYSAQLPQMMRLCGIERFLTQKISWNLFNKFPHHTFFWHGIDGSRVLAHFPPGDSYCMEVKIDELKRSVDNFTDKGRSGHSVYLYGFGDGGQGPTEEMIENLHLLADCEGLPRVQHSTPDAFFSTVEASDANRLCSWHGELYLELHNGTYTTQRKVKLRNAEMERLLKFLELAFAFEFAVTDTVPSLSAVHDLWRATLLHQFHDVIPGTCIEKVYKDVHRMYEESFRALLLLLSGISDRLRAPSNLLSFNSTQWPIIVEMEGELREMQPLSSMHLPVTDPLFLRCSGEGDGFRFLENSFFTAKVDSFGRICSLKLQELPHWELVPADCPMAGLCLYEDVPLYWDAWDIMDYNWETRCPIERLPEHRIVSPLTVTRLSEHEIHLTVKHKLSAGSEVSQTLIFRSYLPYIHFRTEVSWDEAHKLLRVEFPTTISVGSAEYEIQMGSVRRTNCPNTSWDTAQHEVCSHRWMDLSEQTFGISLLKEAIFGGLIRHNTLHLSLLRSPKSPDANADIGSHELHFALFPHAGDWRMAGTVSSSHQFCEVVSPRARKDPIFLQNAVPGLRIDAPLVNLRPAEVGSKSLPNSVVISSIKLGYDNPRAIIIRLYESFGASTTAVLEVNCDRIASLRLVNCLEEPLNQNVKTLSANEVELPFKPFEIVTVMVELK